MPETVFFFTLLGAVYLVAVTVYIVSGNRRPRSSFAWLLLFVFLPVAGLALYVLFGRMRGGVGRTRRLARHDLPAHLAETLKRVEAEHNAALVELASILYLPPKTVIIDGEVASVGSGNWDIRSFSINYELNALVHDDNVATARHCCRTHA